jgi:hypothetical protein
MLGVAFLIKGDIAVDASKCRVLAFTMIRDLVFLQRFVAEITGKSNHLPK